MSGHTEIKFSVCTQKQGNYIQHIFLNVHLKYLNVFENFGHHALL